MERDLFLRRTPATWDLVAVAMVGVGLSALERRAQGERGVAPDAILAALAQLRPHATDRLPLSKEQPACTLYRGPRTLMQVCRWLSRLPESELRHTLLDADGMPNPLALGALIAEQWLGPAPTEVSSQPDMIQADLRGVGVGESNLYPVGIYYYGEEGDAHD